MQMIMTCSCSSTSISICQKFHQNCKYWCNIKK